MNPRALLSVTDKTGLVPFAEGLVSFGFELLSTGGTARALREAGLEVLDVSEVTGFPEMMDGRLKTLHPMVHGGLLADLRLPEHVAAMEEAGMRPISVVAVNLYAFEKTVSGEHTLDQAIESIDIGGPTMIRAAAKNHASVAVVVDPADYPVVLAALGDGGLGLALEPLSPLGERGRGEGSGSSAAPSPLAPNPSSPGGRGASGDRGSLRLSLAAKAFRHTAYYDSMIGRYLTARAGESPYSETLTVGYRRAAAFRYGENPHQAGALYHDPLGQPGLALARQVWGWDMGYNNWNDADGAWELVADLPGTACAITKHGNPCGAAVAPSFAEAFRRARDADPISAFGGVVAFNGPLTHETAAALCEKGNKLDVIVATSISDDALALFKEGKGWRQEVRILQAPLPPSTPGISVRGIRGGALAQDTDEDPGKEWQVVTRRAPTSAEMEALRLQWRIVPHVKSNAIVIGTADRLLGVGAGQMNRVQSVRLALLQAGEGARGASLASDAFFPFPDGVEAAAAGGVTAIVQPGGSKKDPDVIARADELGLAMVFAGARHFRH